MPKLLFITTTNLSTNPRLLKELKLANKNGYDCTFIGFKLGNWSDKTENDHLKSLIGVKAFYLSAGISTSFNVQVRWWLSAVEAKYLSTLIWKLSIAFNRFSPKNLKISAFAHNKRTWQICEKLKKEKDNYDLIVAHNLGALYPSYKLAKRRNIPFAFDIEDYHPGEKCSSAERQRREILMQKLIPQAAYISYASPLIGEYSGQLISNPVQNSFKKLESIKYLASGTKCISRSVCEIGMINEMKTDDEKNLEDNLENGHFERLNNLFLNKSMLINNSFSQNEFEFRENVSEKIQFVWFSQNITWGRGLEQLVPALAKFKSMLQLNLIGNKREDFHKEYLKRYDEFINYIEPLPQKELNRKISDYDIGLAIEISDVDINKDIALSNKIFAYTQAGLYILATDTYAQKMFIEEHNESFFESGFDCAQPPTKGALSEAEMPPLPNKIGLLTAQTTEEMEKTIEEMIDNIVTIRANKKARFEYAKQLAWENEGEKLLNIWSQLL